LADVRILAVEQLAPARGGRSSRRSRREVIKIEDPTVG
jgi:hypothetical protein